jgi:hypothetical protein
MCKDFPQRDDKSGTTHNVHQTTTVEEMGRNLPRIYVMLDNKQDEF